MNNMFVISISEDGDTEDSLLRPGPCTSWPFACSDPGSSSSHAGLSGTGLAGAEGGTLLESL